MRGGAMPDQIVIFKEPVRMSNEPPLTLKVSRLRPDARLPTKAYQTDACFDLYCVEPIEVHPNEPVKVRTGIAIELAPGWYAQILGRSSLAAKGVAILGGVMDPFYRGEWVVCLSSLSHFYIMPGDRVAQFVLNRVAEAIVIEADDLVPTDRGIKAFGSSGR